MLQQPELTSFRCKTADVKEMKRTSRKLLRNRSSIAAVSSVGQTKTTGAIPRISVWKLIYWQVNQKLLKEDFATTCG